MNQHHDRGQLKEAAATHELALRQIRESARASGRSLPGLSNERLALAIVQIRDIAIKDLATRLAAHERNLEELAASVACEAKAKWHEPFEDEVSLPLCSHSVTQVLNDKDLKKVASRLPPFLGLIEARETLTYEAAAQMWMTHWQVSASSRFRARTTILGYIALIARHGGARSDKRARQNLPLLDGDDAADTAAGVGVDIEKQDEVQILMTALETLSPRQRLVMELSLAANLNGKEIAVKLGISEPRVTELKAIAKKKLKEYLRWRLGDDHVE